MGRRPRLLAPGVLYHVIVRGKQDERRFSATPVTRLFGKARPLSKAIRRDRLRLPDAQSRPSFGRDGFAAFIQVHAAR